MAAADSAAVARLATQLGYPSTADQVERRFGSLRDLPDARVLVAEDPDGAVVGWIHVFANRFLESDAGAEIGGLIVDERARGRGVGKALIHSAETWARERGYDLISVRSNVVREAAHEFYKGLGYEVVKAQLKLRKKLKSLEDRGSTTR